MTTLSGEGKRGCCNWKRGMQDPSAVDLDGTSLSLIFFTQKTSSGERMLRATSSTLSCVVLLLPVCVVPLLPVCIVFLLPVCVGFLLSFIVRRAPPPCVRCVPQPYRRSGSSSPCASRSSRVRCARYSDPVSVSPTP